MEKEIKIYYTNGIEEHCKVKDMSIKLGGVFQYTPVNPLEKSILLSPCSYTKIIIRTYNT